MLASLGVFFCLTLSGEPLAWGYALAMTDQELAPFVGKNVAVHHTAGNVVTGTLRQIDPAGPYAVHSVDGEVPPVPFLKDEIVRIES